jgi:hypothetical protein
MIFLKGVGLDRRGAGKLITCIQELAGQLDDVPVLSEFTQREGRYRARRQQTSDRVEKLVFAIFRSFFAVLPAKTAAFGLVNRGPYPNAAEAATSWSEAPVGEE